jgi:hypothetical protein
MGKHNKAKSWLYLRWMVRGSPDLGIFQFNPKDLMVSLTTPKFRVYAALGLSDNENLPFELNIKNRPESWWKNTAEFDDDAERLTDFAKSLFPEDPGAVDFPFFILGTWLEYSDLTDLSGAFAAVLHTKTRRIAKTPNAVLNSGLSLQPSWRTH